LLITTNLRKFIFNNCHPKWQQAKLFDMKTQQALHPRDTYKLITGLSNQTVNHFFSTVNKFISGNPETNGNIFYSPATGIRFILFLEIRKQSGNIL